MSPASIGSLVLLVLGNLGCADNATSVGSVPATNPSGARPAAPRCDNPEDLAGSRLAELVGALQPPALLQTATRNYRQTDFWPMDALPNGASLEQGTYSASQSEFDAGSVSIKAGVARFLLQKKPADLAAKSPDKPYWGSGLVMPNRYPAGLFVARFKTQAVPHSVAAVFVAHDRTDSDGRPLGWTGPVLGFSDDARDAHCIFNDSNSATWSNSVAELGFDAADEFHVYALEVVPGRMGYYVDGELVHSWDNLAKEVEPAAPLGLHLTLWLQKASMPLGDAAFPVATEVDYFAAYELTGCR